jgi:signal peptidase I
MDCGAPQGHILKMYILKHVWEYMLNLGKLGGITEMLNKILCEIFELVKTVVLAVILAWLITTFVIANSVIPTGSMESTIMTGSRVVGNRLAYKFADPEFGDIIIFKNPNDESVYFVKRLIGLPGDTIEIVRENEETGEGYVLRNGERLDEDYINGVMFVMYNQKFEVPEDCYFFLGDNRNFSNDARYWENTYVHKNKLVAKVLFQYWKGFKWLDK